MAEKTLRECPLEIGQWRKQLKEGEGKERLLVIPPSLLE